MNMQHPGSIDPLALSTSWMEKKTQSAPALQLQHDSSFFGNMAQTLQQPETQSGSSGVAGPGQAAEKGKQPDNSPSNADGPGLKHTGSGDTGGTEEIN